MRYYNIFLRYLVHILPLKYARAWKGKAWRDKGFQVTTEDIR